MPPMHGLLLYQCQELFLDIFFWPYYKKFMPFLFNWIITAIRPIYSLEIDVNLFQNTICQVSCKHFPQEILTSFFLLVVVHTPFTFSGVHLNGISQIGKECFEASSYYLHVYLRLNIVIITSPRARPCANGGHNIQSQFLRPKSSRLFSWTIFTVVELPNAKLPDCVDPSPWRSLLYINGCYMFRTLGTLDLALKICNDKKKKSVHIHYPVEIFTM